MVTVIGIDIINVTLLLFSLSLSLQLSRFCRRILTVNVIIAVTVIVTVVVTFVVFVTVTVVALVIVITCLRRDVCCCNHQTIAFVIIVSNCPPPTLF